MLCPIDPKLFTDEWNGQTLMVGLFFASINDETGEVYTVWRIDSIASDKMFCTRWSFCYHWEEHSSLEYDAAFRGYDRFLPPLIQEMLDAVPH